MNDTNTNTGKIEAATREQVVKTFEAINDKTNPGGSIAGFVCSTAAASIIDKLGTPVVESTPVIYLFMAMLAARELGMTEDDFATLLDNTDQTYTQTLAPGAVV